MRAFRRAQHPGNPHAQEAHGPATSTAPEAASQRNDHAMAATSRIPDDKRQQILDAIRAGAGTRARADIAREYGVSGPTVGKIAREAGITDAFDRSRTEAATQAASADAAARRAKLSSELLDKVDVFLGKLGQDWTKTVVVPGQGTRKVEADTVEIATGIQRLMTSVGITIDKHLALIKFDAGDTGADEAKSMLLGVAEGLKSMYVATQMNAEPDGPDA